jgi:single-strand DNA-binding protein
MNNLNSILVEGDLVRDPNLSRTPRGTQVCSFCLASSRYYHIDKRQQKEVSFFEVEIWSKLAGVCAENLKKGQRVRVVGRLKQDRWSDTEGKNHSRIKIIGDHVEFNPVSFHTKRSGAAVPGEEAAIFEESYPPGSSGASSGEENP